ncbi:hypothetical protein [Nitrosococcus watsonii]|uniref:Uncharacterized protein n=1 Tax=Nitrosococcus watsoni (strain C-113) TaxID=105559 RepID=D8KCD6_NITWC|nr:hypothetical protein [Nitrosococcus watsonii]ADJ29877.1 conserved hypothetical protein [Nitrosococcus watsonii C-113]
MTADLDLFKECYRRADEAIANASKNELAECARILALNVAHYQQQYGNLPLEEQNKLFNANEIEPETAKLLAAGMLQLLSSLAVATGDAEAFGKYEAMKQTFH